jgi:hypothetical protein
MSSADLNPPLQRAGPGVVPTPEINATSERNLTVKGNAQKAPSSCKCAAEEMHAFSAFAPCSPGPERFGTWQSMERRLAVMERSRAARLASAYYMLYSRPLLGLPLRLVRRTAGGICTPERQRRSGHLNRCGWRR